MYRQIFGFGIVFCFFFSYSFSNEALTLVVPGKRLDTKSFYFANKPADTELISSKDIAFLKPKNTASFISEFSGYTLSSTGIGEKQTLSSRGYADKNSVLVFVDGVKQNDLNNDTVPWEAIPLESIERLELLKGGNSLIYGMGAVGGVINIITAKKNNVFYSQTLANNKGRGEKKGYNLLFPLPYLSPSLYYSDSQGNNSRDNSEYALTNFHYSLGFTPYNFLTILAEQKSFNSKSLMPGPLSYYEFLNSPNASHYGSNDYYSENGQETRYNANLDVFSSKLTTQYYIKNRKQLSRSDSTYFTVSADMQRKGVVSLYESKFPVCGINNNFTLGYEHEDSSITNQDNWNPASSLAGFSDSFFITNQLPLAEALLLDMGIRKDNFQYNYNNIYLYYDANSFQSVYGSGSRSFSGLSPGLGISFQPSEEWSLFANCNSSFKVMPLEDFAVYSPSYNVNLALNPQINNSLEIGVSHTQQSFKIELSGYLSSIKDEILFNDVSYKNENFNTLHKGFKVKLNYSLGPVIGNIVFEKNQGFLETSALNNNLKAGASIPNIPDYELKSRLKYALGSAFIALDIKNVGNSFAINDFQQKGRPLTNYTLVDMLFLQNFSNLEFSLKLENIFDVNYATYSAYGNFSGNQTFYPGNKRNLQIYFDYGL